MKKYYVLPLFVLFCALLTACSEDIPEAKDFQVKHNGQTLSVYFLYDEILDYTSEAKNMPSKEKKELYLEKVTKPFQEIAEKHDINIGNYYFGYFNGDTDIKQLEKNTIKLLKKQDEVESLVKKAFVKSNEVLPGGDKSLFLIPINPDFTFPIEKMEGSTGVTFTDEFMLIQLDPSYKKEAVASTVTHDYFHAVDMEDGGGQPTVLDSILMEGKAESFARIVYPDKINPWSEPLTETEKKNVFSELKGKLHSLDYHVYQTLFAGDPSKGIPLWSNYKLGVEMTQEYLALQPELTPKEWVFTKNADPLESFSQKDKMISAD